MMGTTEPLAAPGWYPDPEQVATQRYWDGEHWTDQRAPLASPVPATAPSPFTSRSVLGGLGGLVAAVGVFLPQLDSETSLHIAHNSVIGNEALAGIFTLLLAAAAASAAYRTRNDPAHYTTLVILGGLLITAAIYSGTGDRLALETTGPASFGDHALKATPGIGIWVIGIGGVLIAAAGLVRGDRPKA
jgi:hypothetical protein